MTGMCVSLTRLSDRVEDKRYQPFVWHLWTCGFLYYLEYQSEIQMINMKHNGFSMSLFCFQWTVGEGNGQFFHEVENQD